MMYPKTRPVKDEAYRRLVAALPCIACGVHGYSQAAHPNTGKGMGRKTSDRDCFPLCCDRPGVRGCHDLFDKNVMFKKADRQATEQRWTKQTQRMLNAA